MSITAFLDALEALPVHDAKVYDVSREDRQRLYDLASQVASNRGVPETAGLDSALSKASLSLWVAAIRAALPELIAKELTK